MCCTRSPTPATDPAPARVPRPHHPASYPDPREHPGPQAQRKPTRKPAQQPTATRTKPPPPASPAPAPLGLKYRGTPGTHNAITDVPGVEVGYRTLIEGDNVRTGVTAIHPRGKGNPGDPVAAGYHSLNGNGEMTGVSWIEESGTCQGPIAITNTHAVGIAHAGIIAWMNQYHPDLTDVWLLPVAAETWDGYLNDINGHHVNEDTVIEALESATQQQPDEGSVGGGTGMNCYQFKGGNGTASRLVEYNETTYTVGVFLQANFGRRARSDAQRRLPGGGARRRQPDARLLQRPAGRRVGDRRRRHRRPVLPQPVQVPRPEGHPRPGPHRHDRQPLLRRHLPRRLHRQRRRLLPEGPGARRPRTAPTTAPRYGHLEFIPWDAIDPFYAAVVQATEEAVANALIANEDMTGRDGHRSPALPRHRLAEILSRTRETREA